MPHADKRMVTILLTTRCNLRCTYCYSRHERSVLGEIDIDIDFAKCGIADYFSENPPGIRYFGLGEPTLKFELIQQLHEFAGNLAARRGETLVSEIQTNGLMSESMAQWLAEEIDNIWISIDGSPAIQDEQRPGPGGRPSSVIVEKNLSSIVRVKEQTKRGFVGARATITPANTRNQIELIDYLSGLGVTLIFSDPVCLAVETEPHPHQRSVDPVDYAREFVRAHNYAKAKGIFYGNFYMVNFGAPTNIHCRANIPTPHLTPDGHVSCCDMSCSLKTNTFMRDCLYGAWNRTTRKIDYWQQRIDAIRARKVDNLPECRDCSIKYNCAGGCLGEALNETGTFLGIHKRACEATRLVSQSIDPHVSLPVLHP